jgi:hypothetical protein
MRIIAPTNREQSSSAGGPLGVFLADQAFESPGEPGADRAQRTARPPKGGGDSYVSTLRSWNGRRSSVPGVGKGAGRLQRNDDCDQATD